MRRWSRLTLRAQKDRWGGTHTMLCTALPGYQPGEEVVVMPAGDADAMLAILGRVGHMVPKLIQPSKLEQDAYELWARLSAGPSPAKCRMHPAGRDLAHVSSHIHSDRCASVCTYSNEEDCERQAASNCTCGGAAPGGGE